METFLQCIKDEYKGDDREALLVFLQDTCDAIPKGSVTYFAWPGLADYDDDVGVIGFPGTGHTGGAVLKTLRASLANVRRFLQQYPDRERHLIFVPTPTTRTVGIGAIGWADEMTSNVDADVLALCLRAMMAAYEGLVRGLVEEHKIAVHCHRDIVRHGAAGFHSKILQDQLENVSVHQELVDKFKAKLVTEDEAPN